MAACDHVLLRIAVLLVKKHQYKKAVPYNTIVRDDFVKPNLAQVYFRITDREKLKAQLTDALNAFNQIHPSGRLAA